MSAPLHPRILLVDDDPRILRSMARVFTAQAEVETATSATEALSRLEINRFGAVVTDYQMPPDEDGLCLLQQVQVKHPRVVRIMTSAVQRSSVLKRIRTSPAVQHFFPKPATIAKIMECLAAVPATVAAGVRSKSR